MCGYVCFTLLVFRRWYEDGLTPGYFPNKGALCYKHFLIKINVPGKASLTYKLYWIFSVCDEIDCLLIDNAQFLDFICLFSRNYLCVLVFFVFNQSIIDLLFVFKEVKITKEELKEKIPRIH